MNLLKAQYVLFTIVSTILSTIPATEEVLTKCVMEWPNEYMTEWNHDSPSVSNM